MPACSPETTGKTRPWEHWGLLVSPSAVMETAFRCSMGRAEEGCSPVRTPLCWGEFFPILPYNMPWVLFSDDKNLCLLQKISRVQKSPKKEIKIHIVSPQEKQMLISKHSLPLKKFFCTLFYGKMRSSIYFVSQLLQTQLVALLAGADENKENPKLSLIPKLHRSQEKPVWTSESLDHEWMLTFAKCFFCFQ